MIEYRTVKKQAEAQIIEKKSKFIAQVQPVDSVDQAEQFIADIKEKHKTASHNVPAYIIGLQGEVQKCSDDGEPSGSAGAPVLEVLKSLELVNIVVVVTRYFGGTLLGRGGLIRAYSRAAKEGVQAAGLVRMVQYQRCQATVDYTLAGKVQNELLTLGVDIEDIAYTAEVTFHICLEPSRTDEISGVIRDITADNFRWQTHEKVYVSRALE